MLTGKRLISVFAVLALLLSSLPAAMAADKPLYKAETSDDCIVREAESESAKIVARIAKGQDIDIYQVDPEWVKAGYNGKKGYIMRTQVTGVTPIDPVNTPPYGVFKHTYFAVAAGVTPVLSSPQASAEALITLQAGAKVSILDITDGWARIPFKRVYGYVDTRLLADLAPVSVTDTPISDETPIAAFTSFYKVVETEINLGRMENIKVACRRLSRVIEAGATLDFNAQIGPYKKSLGYKEANVLINGKAQPGYGGGTCQVSSTLYNTILQLPKIEVIYRRPHGPAGAPYLPHGVDAAVGNDFLNLVFRNDYDFPIRVEASAQDGALFICIYKQ